MCLKFGCVAIWFAITQNDADICNYVCWPLLCLSVIHNFGMPVVLLHCILDAYGCDDASTILSDYVRMLASSSLVTIFLLLPEIGLHFFL